MMTNSKSYTNTNSRVIPAQEYRFTASGRQ